MSSKKYEIDVNSALEELGAICSDTCLCLQSKNVTCCLVGNLIFSSGFTFFFLLHVTRCCDDKKNCRAPSFGCVKEHQGIKRNWTINARQAYVLEMHERG